MAELRGLNQSPATHPMTSRCSGSQRLGLPVTLFIGRGSLLVAWPDHLGAMAQRLQAVSPCERRAYIEELLSTTARKSRWQLAESQGEANP